MTGFSFWNNPAQESELWLEVLFCTSLVPLCHCGGRGVGHGLAWKATFPTGWEGKGAVDQWGRSEGLQLAFCTMGCASAAAKTHCCCWRWSTGTGCPHWEQYKMAFIDIFSCGCVDVLTPCKMLCETQVIWTIKVCSRCRSRSISLQHDLV